MTAWPRLDYAADRATYETIHAVLQLVGKLPTRLLPWIAHGWHAALRVTPNGYITYPMPAGDGRCFTVELDAREAALAVRCDDGGLFRTAVAGRSVAQIRRDLGSVLAKASLPAPLHGGPNEVPDPVPFARDDARREWDADAATRLHRAFVQADRAFTRFRAQYLGKTSPSHLFWGSFDLAVTRFSGRRAPPHPGGFPALPDAVTRDAYSHEVISAGFWPGGTGVEEAAFYTYAYPSPAGLADAAIAPEATHWHGGLGEFILPYSAVLASDEPDRQLLRFLQSAYDAAADLLDWPEGLALEAATYGRPAQQIAAPGG